MGTAFLDRLNREVLLADGAMGTLLLARLEAKEAGDKSLLERFKDLLGDKAGRARS